MRATDEHGAEGDPPVEFLWWRECPSSERALALLREAMAAEGLGAEALQVREIRSESEARQAAFPGSPTIRVGGVDIDEGGARSVGLTCRVYRRADGRVSPLPDREQIEAALRRGRRGMR